MRRISGAYRCRYTDGTGREHIEYETFSDVVSTDIADDLYSAYLMISGIYKAMQYLMLDPSTDLLDYELLDYSVDPMN